MTRYEKENIDITSDSASNDWLCQWWYSVETETSSVDTADTGRPTDTVLNSGLSTCPETLQTLILQTRITVQSLPLAKKQTSVHTNMCHV